jgi:hypothetical protein
MSCFVYQRPQFKACHVISYQMRTYLIIGGKETLGSGGLLVLNFLDHLPAFIISCALVRSGQCQIQHIPLIDLTGVHDTALHILRCIQRHLEMFCNVDYHDSDSKSSIIWGVLYLTTYMICNSKIKRLKVQFWE